MTASVAFCNAYEKGKLGNITIQVSNSSVLKFKVLSDTKIGGVLYPKKAGKATITYIADSGNRKIKEVYHINIIKFTNPFTSITYGGKDISGKIKDTYNEITVPKGKADSKIEYKLKPGWKVRYKNESSVEVWQEDRCLSLCGCSCEIIIHIYEFWKMRCLEKLKTLINTCLVKKQGGNGDGLLRFIRKPG